MNILIATDVYPSLEDDASSSAATHAGKAREGMSGGSSWSTFHLAHALHARGHCVRVVVPQPGMEGIRARSTDGVEVVQVGYRATNIAGARAWQRTRALDRTLGTYLATEGRAFDAIHAQHVLSISAAVTAKKVSGVPVASTVRDYWHLCLYGTLWRDGAICPICRGSEIRKCLAQRYGSAARWMQPVVPLVERELARRQRALQHSDAVIAPGEFIGSTLEGIVEAGRLWVVPNLVDTAKITETARAVTNTPVAPPYLMFIGKLNLLKGADLLSEIMDKVGTRLPLVVAGDGELRHSLAKIEGFELCGWLPNEETLGLLARARALLFPSRWAEPLARTLLEAQALGIPTVAWNSGGNRDIIRDNFNGLLADNVDNFAMQVRRLLEDENLSAQLGENARRTAQTRYSPDAVIPQFEKIYQAVSQNT